MIFLSLSAFEDTYKITKEFHKLLEDYEKDISVSFVSSGLGKEKILRITKRFVNIPASDGVYVINLDFNTDFPYKYIEVWDNYELYRQIVRTLMNIDIYLYPLKITRMDVIDEKFTHFYILDSIINLTFQLEHFFECINKKIIKINEEILSLIKRYSYIVINGFQSSNISMSFKVGNYTITPYEDATYIEYRYVIDHDNLYTFLTSKSPEYMAITNLVGFLDYISDEKITPNIRYRIACKNKDNHSVIITTYKPFNNILNEVYYNSIARNKQYHDINVYDLFCSIHPY